jgi:nucleoside-diphosphate-sugar epimerase
VALRLADLGRCRVRAVARSADRLEGFLALSETDIELFQADTTDPESLGPALADCAALVIVTGTTAFPTLAWRNGNTPQAVDDAGVRNVLAAWRAGSGPKKRVVLMSSIGVARREQFPFRILNAAGVLDAKAGGEAALRAAAEGHGAWLDSCCVVRPGQLVGGPYDNNYYLGTLAKLDRPARSVLLWDETPKNAVALAAGDTLLGDTLRSTAAELVVRALLTPGCAADFSVVNVDGPRPSEAAVAAQLAALA